MKNISRKAFLQKSAVAVIAPAIGCSSENLETKEKSAKPNLLFVFADEYRRQAVGCMGQDPVITPNLDRFALESLLLTDAVSCYPVCSPYRAQLMTGKYPQSNGVLTNTHSGSDVFLARPERCISDVLLDCGYGTGYIGKWHLDHPHEPYVGIRRGDGRVWDEFVPPERRHGFQFWHSYNCRDTHFSPSYWTTHAARDEKADIDDWSTRHETDVAIDFIRNRDGKHRDPDKPFALFVSHNPPHMPFAQVPPEYLELYEGKTYRDLLNRPNVDLDNPHPEAKKQVKNYFAAVSGTDDQFGLLLACLREEGLEENTIVVFTSDHGEMMGSQGRMNKGVCYEESFGIPFIIRWPGKIAPRRDDLLLAVPDLMPTLLALMGFSTEVPPGVEGADLSDAVLGRDCPRPESALYMNTDYKKHGRQLAESGARGVRTHRHTFSISLDNGGGRSTLLFDNLNDPYQLENLAGRKPALEWELGEELSRWLERTGDPWPGLNVG